MSEIAWRMNRQMTPGITCPAPDRMACETTDEGLREMTPEMALHTMCDTTLLVMYEIVPGTMYDTTLSVTSSTV
jgi:hypothetical protein